MRGIFYLACYVLLLLSLQPLFAVPIFDGSKVAERTSAFDQIAAEFKGLKTKYIDKYTANIQGSSDDVDAWSNGFANQIIRNNQARLSASNQALKLSSEPVDICENYSLSTALNDLTCEGLSSWDQTSSAFIQESQNPLLVSKGASEHSVSDINTISVSNLPVIDANHDVMTQSAHLQEQAYKSTVHTLTQSIKTDQQNLYNPLSNQANDDFGTAEIKKIQETYNRSQLYRKMAVMLAQKNYAVMLAYKHQLQSELAMAMQLLQEVKRQYR